jgi:Small protein A (tmRNA-binding)
MKVFTRIAIGGAMVAALAGCSSIKDHRGYLVDQALIDSVQPGIDNRASVERTLGRPTFASQFGEKSWYYVSINTRQAAFTRPRPYEETVLKVDFTPDGTVANVQRTGIEKSVRLDPNGKKTPTLGRDRSFFEDLFGNIGSVGAAGLGGTGPSDNTGGPNGS